MSYTYETETLYKIGQDDKGDLLYLREVEDGFHYETYNMETKKREYDGLLTWGDMEDCPIRNPLAAARTLAIEDVGLDYGPIARVSLKMLENYPQSEIRGRAVWDPDTLPQHDIRFIDSRYNDLFRIPDGGTIQVDYPDRHFSARCKYLDDYHTSINGEVYHICQFAEILERNGGSCQPEPESSLGAGGWRLGYSNFLTVETYRDGWNYTLYDRDFRKLSKGHLDNPNLSLREAREEVLTGLKMENRGRTKLPFEYIKDKAKERVSKDKAEARESALGELSERKKEMPLREAAQKDSRKIEEAHLG